MGGLAVVIVGLGLAAPSTAATPEGQITITPSSSAPTPSGTAVTSTITVSCGLSQGMSCGPGAEITIPLSTTTTPPMTTWTFQATSPVTGLIDGNPTVASDGQGGQQLVIGLDPNAFVGGFSGAVTLSMTPPNGSTANATQWSLAPTLQSPTIGSVLVTTPETGSVTASPSPSVTVATSDGSTSVKAGATLTYDITPACESLPAGELLPTGGTLVDQLPSGVTYGSSSHGGSYDAVANTVSWNYTTAEALPSGCGGGAAGPGSSRVTVQVPADAVSGTTLADQATFTLTGPDASSPSGLSKSSSDQSTVTVAASKPASGSSAGKGGGSGSTPPTEQQPFQPDTASGVAQVEISRQSGATSQTGNAVTYSISASCESTESVCVDAADPGNPVTITIPLNQTVGGVTNNPLVDMSPTNGWTYAALGSPTGFVASGPTYVNDPTNGPELVLTLTNADFAPGASGTINLQVTPPTDITPNNTAWSLQPTIAGGDIAAPDTAPAPATVTATAAPLPVVTKLTADGGSVYLDGSTVTYNLTASCNPGTPGNLFLTDGTATLVDQLPSGLTYVPGTATPAGGVYDAGANTVTWTFGTGTGQVPMPTGCAAGATGTNAYSLQVNTPDTPTDGLKNTATFAGTGPDSHNPAGVSGSTDATVTIDTLATPPTGCTTPPCTGYPTITKSALAPLAVLPTGQNQYLGTYPGNWTPVSSTPSYSVGAAAASYHVNVAFPLTGTYETDLTDPVPRLTDTSGNNSSNDPGTVCANPAFHTQIIEVTSPGLATAIADGWNATATLTDGSTINLVLGANSGNSAYFSVPAGDDVSSIDVPPSADIEGNSLTLTLWGYADASLLGGSSMTNTATATPQLDGAPLSPIDASAELFVVAPTFQLGISKSFGPPGAGPGGSTILDVLGTVSEPAADAPLAYPVVLTDLLPTGLTWANPQSGSVSGFTLTLGSGSPTPVSASVADLPNYEGTGRELVRVTLPTSAFTTSGNWLITPPANFLEVSTPTTPGTYSNTDQIFLAGVGNVSDVVSQQCTTPTQSGGGNSPATYESDNPLDLAGDGNTQEPYCQNAANLVISPSGAAFNLTKNVLGNIDQANGQSPKGPLGVSNASLGGSAVYGLNWTNTGNDQLDDVAVYDILPYVGDTGVASGQTNVQRGSQWATTFASASSSDPNVTVQYATVDNPCRPEVGVTTGCVANAFSPTEPADPSTVKALEFFSSATYATGGSFAMTINVDVPNDSSIANQIAWNSAASDATDASNPSTSLLPAEPPKVGIVAVNGSSAPPGNALSTGTTVTNLDVYQSTSPAGVALNDYVTILGSASTSGDTLHWSLQGPVAVGPDDTCATADWADLPGTPVASGSVSSPALGLALTTGPATVQGQGCYSWVDTLVAPDGTTVLASSPAGTANEVVQALPYTPTLNTGESNSANATTGVQKVKDQITVTGTGIPSGLGITAPLDWQLLGPVTPISGSCPSSASPEWSGAAVFASGTITVTGDGSYSTPNTTIPVSSANDGCYSFAETLGASPASTAVTLAPGTIGETFPLFPITAAVTTSSNTTGTVNPRTQVTDAVTVADSANPGQAGSVAWSLVEVAGATDCTGLDWTSAVPVVIGTTTQAGTTTVPTITTGGTTVNTSPAATVAGPGCYSWVETLTGPNYLGQTTLPAGTAGETFQVTPYQPALATTAEVMANADGTKTVYDTIQVTNFGHRGPGRGFPGRAAPHVAAVRSGADGIAGDLSRVRRPELDCWVAVGFRFGQRGRRHEHQRRAHQRDGHDQHPDH